DVFSIIDVVLRQESVKEIDAAFVVGLVCGHVVSADEVIDTFPRTADRGYNKVTGFQLAHIWAYLLHHPKAFMTRDQKVISLRSASVFGGIDFFVGAINAHAQNAH